jgi:hypothetical protein
MRYTMHDQVNCMGYKILGNIADASIGGGCGGDLTELFDTVIVSVSIFVYIPAYVYG